MRLPAVLLATGVLIAGAVTPAHAQAVSLAQTTTVGVHNTYEQGTYDYLARSLDNGAALLEFDVWPNFITQEWKVSHDNPFGNKNNCVAADSPDDLYTGGRNKNLEHCLDDVRVWLEAHPDQGPIMIKLELKPGFSDNTGRGPDELDRTIRTSLGSRVFRPADLLGSHASLDAAAKAGAWPSRDAMKGKVIFEVIPGTVEQQNPTDTLWTDVEYARYLNGLRSAGRFGEGQIFPSVLGAASGDPRTRYADAALRPYFVVFDGSAGSYVGGIDTQWYKDNNYLLVMTDAHAVAPAIDARNPSVEQANARVAQLADAGASVVTSDWAGLTSVLSQVLPRG